MEQVSVKPSVERTVRERYLAHVVIPPGGEKDPSACWQWRGATHSQTGVGILQVAKGRGGHWAANRVGWSLLHGPLLPWQVLIHEGGENPTCSRGSHWRLVPGAKRRAGKTKRYSARRRAELLDYAARMGVVDCARAFEVPPRLLERWRTDARRKAMNGATHHTRS